MRRAFQSTKKEIMVEKKKIVLKTISSILFLFCLIFVFLRGKDCFSKYLSKPQFVDTAYRLSGHMPFPSITICSTVFKWLVFKVRVGRFTNAGYHKIILLWPNTWLQENQLILLIHFLRNVT